MCRNLFSRAPDTWRGISSTFLVVSSVFPEDPMMIWRLDHEHVTFEAPLPPVALCATSGKPSTWLPLGGLVEQAMTRLCSVYMSCAHCKREGVYSVSCMTRCRGQSSRRFAKCKIRGTVSVDLTTQICKMISSDICWENMYHLNVKQTSHRTCMHVNIKMYEAKNTSENKHLAHRRKHAQTYSKYMRLARKHLKPECYKETQMCFLF